MSVYLLCDVGLSPTIAQKLYSYNYDIDYYKKNESFIDGLYGERSLKAKEIKKALKKVDELDYSESVYILLEYGLSLVIIKKMRQEKVFLKDLENINFYNKMINKLQFKNVTTQKIFDAYNNYCKNKGNRIIADYSKEIIKILHSMKKEYISIDDLKSNEKYIKLNIDTETMIKNLNRLEENGKIEIDNGTIKVFYLSLKDYINTIEKESWRGIIAKVFKGETFSGIGQELGLSRERIRQISNNVMKKIPFLKEDLLSNIFCKYQWEEVTFCDVLEEPIETYYYLKNKYRVGETDIYEIFDTDDIDLNQKEKLKRHLNLITYNNIIFPAKKMQLLETIIMTEKRLLSIDEIVEIYNNLVDKEFRNYSIPKISKDDIRNVEGMLNRSNKIVLTYNRKYRYYNYEALSENDINDIREMLNVKKGIYSSDYFFVNNVQLMHDLDIQNQYELHNILRRIVPNNDIIRYGRMPEIFIGENNKVEFFIKLINILSPITVEDFEKILKNSYGHDIKTIHSYLLTELSVYITNGIINTRIEEFNETQLNIIKPKLVRNIYSINEIEKVLKDTFGEKYVSYLNNLNFNRIGFRVREQYIYNTKIDSVDRYLRETILKEDIYEEKDELLSAGSSYTWVLGDLLIKNHIFKIGENKYITFKGLNRFNIGLEKIKQIQNRIFNSFSKGDIFNLYMLEKRALITEEDYLGFDKVFIESLLQYTKGLYLIKIENNLLYVKSEKSYTKSGFIGYIIEKNCPITTDGILKVMKNDYNFVIDKYETRYLIDKRKYYRDVDTDIIKII